MAETTRSATYVKRDDKKFTITWEGLDSDDTGAAVLLPRCRGLCAQITGDTLGVGGEITMQGSMDATNWGNLTDGGGSDVVLGAIGALGNIAERPLYIKPDVTGGDGTTDLDVVVCGDLVGD